MTAAMSPVIGATVQSFGMPARFVAMALKAGSAIGMWPQAERRAARAPADTPRVIIFLLIMSKRLDWIELSCTAGREEAE
jgi:hypothetical protein